MYVARVYKRDEGKLFDVPGWRWSKGVVNFVYDVLLFITVYTNRILI